MTSAPPRIPRHRPMFADTVPAPRCSGPCAQGRRACPTPAACQCGDDDDTGLPGPAMSAVIAVGLVAVIVAGSLLAGYLSVVLP